MPEYPLDQPRSVQRRLPRLAELAPLLRFQRPHLDGRRRRLARAYTIEDLRQIARRRAPRSVFDYVDGAAEQEISIRRARAAFESVEFHPRVLRDVSSVDTSAEVLGARAAMPLVLAPTGFTRMMHHEGEVAVARAAARAGIPYVLSTMGTTEPEAVRACAPTARQWFQLYLWKDRAASEAIVERALKADYEALVLTVDTPVGGARMRDVRNGLTIPPALTLRTFAGMAVRPAWWSNLLTTEPLTFAAMTSFDGTVADLIAAMFDPAATTHDLQWLRESWPRKLVVKGIQDVEDARMVADLGADAVVVSNHGGRQLDGAVAALDALAEVVEAVAGRAEVYLDGGVRRGTDVVTALALGARAVLVGRPALYGLALGGERGVRQVLEILRDETENALALLGCCSPDEVTAAHVTGPVAA
jgi:L-lactate dehydrogenase (cytochrome)